MVARTVEVGDFCYYCIITIRHPYKATPGGLRGSTAPCITRLFHCHKQFCWTIIIPWSYMVPWYVADERPLPYSSNRLHHLYRSQILICSSVRKVLVPKLHSILICFYRHPWGRNTQGMVGRNFKFHFFTEITMVNVKKSHFSHKNCNFSAVRAIFKNLSHNPLRFTPLWRSVKGN